MDAPEWTKPALLGAAVGAIGLAVVGFTWGGWMTAGQAATMASDQSRVDVVAALMPICVQQAGQDPQHLVMVEALKGAPSYQRTDMVTKAGWATMPGSSDTNRRVAAACADKLAG